MTTPPKCVHWWIVASPRDCEGELTPAFCKHCGAERTYDPTPPAFQPTTFVYGFGAKDPFKPQQDEDAA